jgi:hypothetical protein
MKSFVVFDSGLAASHSIVVVMVVVVDLVDVVGVQVRDGAVLGAMVGYPF